MAIILAIKGLTPEIHSSCFIAENATITGDVKIGAKSSVWYHSVIRGDVCKIAIGERVNVQDAVIIHGTQDLSEVSIGNNVSIGHRAIIHGSVIEDNVLVGMGAIILDNAILRSNCVVAAGSVVLQGQELESGYLYAGVPAKKIKKMDPEKLYYYIEGTATSYEELSGYYPK